MIVFQDVCKHFGKKTPFKDGRKQVLHNVNLTLQKGEIICLLGPSGCGKSTMVNLVIGNLVPSAGTVTVMGEQAPYKNIRAQVGYMPQENALYEDITAEENMRFFGAMNGVSKALLDARIPALLTLVRLEKEGKQLVSTFSGGMKRRLSLAVTLLHDPKLIVLDEPTVGLDPDHRRHIWAHFERLAAEGKTLLITTHVMDEAAHCSRIAMLYNGTLIATGSPASILEKTHTEQLEDAFLALENLENTTEVNHHA